MVIALLATLALQGSEADFWPLTTIEVPDEVVLEVGGMEFLPDGSMLACTRRGQIWRLEGIDTADGEGVTFHEWFDGLQEPLGLLALDGWIYCTQRGELSRLRDSDGDGRADELETLADPWRISGNYHEYCFGPVLDGAGKLWITLNRPFGGEPFGSVDWRGFALRFDPDGSNWEPVVAGLRSPCGIAVSPDGEVFYTDNQGEWCGTNKLAQLEPGDFLGHPWGIESTKRPEWKYGVIPMPKDGILYPDAARTEPKVKLPAIWFPYDVMGRSAAGFVWDTTGGAFGPFPGSVFVGDQYDASVMRVTLEKVGGVWQGACYPFRAGLASGVTRVAWGPDGRSLWVGLTNRGWGSKGGDTQGLQRLNWSGKVPFEIATMRAVKGGFELEFTKEIAPEGASDPATYALQSYTYELHEPYGSGRMEVRELAAAAVTHDGKVVRLMIDGLRQGYVHEVQLGDLRSVEGDELLHRSAYYTLNVIVE
jgi:hypothetical protein